MSNKGHRFKFLKVGSQVFSTKYQHGRVFSIEKSDGIISVEYAPALI